MSREEERQWRGQCLLGALLGLVDPAGVPASRLVLIVQHRFGHDDLQRDRVGHAEEQRRQVQVGREAVKSDHVE